MTADVSPFFNVFSSRCRITGKLVAETPLRVGAGDTAPDPTSIDNSIIRDSFKRPFIPGSSFKGVWRVFSEQVLAGWGKPDGLSAPCDIVNNPCLTVQESKYLKMEYKKDPAMLAESIYDRLCPVCRIFGSQDFAGRIRVRDLLLDESSWLGFCEIRPGVSIDRDTRTAMSGRVYDVEAVPAGTVFNLEVLVENPSPEQWYNILLTLSAFVQGDMLLGGCTSRGLGRVSLREFKVAEINKDNFMLFLQNGWDGIEKMGFVEAFREAGLTGGGDTNV